MNAFTSRATVLNDIAALTVIVASALLVVAQIALVVL